MMMRECGCDFWAFFKDGMEFRRFLFLTWLVFIPGFDIFFPERGGYFVELDTYRGSFTLIDLFSCLFLLW